MNWQNIKNWIAKITLYFVTLVVGLFFICFLVIQVPAVQLKVSNYLLSNLEEQTGFSGKMDKFYLLWYDRLQVNNLTLNDPEGNEMLKVESVYVNFNLSRLIVRKNLELEAILISGGDLHLQPIVVTDSTSTLNLVVFINRITELLKSDKPKTASKVNVGEIILQDMHFSLDDHRKEKSEKGFDFAHFKIDIPSIELQALQFFNDTVQFQIANFNAFERQSELNIKNLQSFFRFSPSGMELLNLSLTTDKSYIGDTVRFIYDSPAALADFINSVDIEARLKNAYLHPDDLAKFLPAAKNLRETIFIDGNFSGFVNSFVFSDMLIKNGNSVLTGRLEMFGLPIIEDTFIDVNLVNSNIYAYDVAQYFDDEISGKIKEIGSIDFNGQFQGFINDFVANGQLETRYGRIISDINVKIDTQNIDLSSYSGRLNLNKFKIGELIGDTTLFQQISLNGRITGKGLNIESADLLLDGKISELGFKGYKYVNINTNARFFSQFFNGYFSIDDPNLSFTAEAMVDLRPDNNTLKIKGELNYASLHNLYLSDKYLFLSSVIDVDIKGFEIDSITGKINLKDFNIVYDENEIALDSIFILSERNGNIKSLSIVSSIADIEMVGNYYYTSFYNDLSTLIYELALQLKNDRSAIREYYSKKNISPADYEVEFKFKLHDINPIISLFTPDLTISPNTTIEGEYFSGYNTMLTAYTEIDSILYTNKLFVNNNIEFNGSKISDSTSVLAMAFINSKEQNLTSKLFTRDLLVEGVWSEDRIDFILDLYQVNTTNYLTITGDVHLRKDSTQIRFNPSQMNVLDNVWNIEQGNRIMIKGNEVKFRNLNFFNDAEIISINGNISENPDEVLLIEFNKVSIGIINPIIGKDLGGVMEGHFELSDIYNNPTIQNRIFIKNQTVNDFLVGDITGNNEWDNNEKRFQINLSIDRLEKRIVNVEGTYDPFLIGEQLNLTADFTEANLNIIEPFLDFFISRIDGTITGKYFVTGNLDLVKIRGDGRIANGQIMVNYLKTLYKFTGNIGMEPDKILFKNLDLKDINENSGRINGFLQHKNFMDMSINLDGTFSNFQVLNTTSKDNELFYGVANASGTVNFLGPVNNMRISSNAKTERGTRISIPLSNSATTVDTKEYINFVNFTDSTTSVELEEVRKTTTALSGISLDFNLEITPDAYCEIIFDLKAGDIIRGRGRGDIVLQLDTKGEFNMFGPIEFTEGAYNFTLYDIVNKEFQIENGSRITWYGDPYLGQMNIQASYNQMASIAPLLRVEDCTAPQLRRKYPIQVLLNLDGQLLSPTINFDITAKDLPDMVNLDGCDQLSIRPDFEFQAFKSRLDDQELKRQVFSLIILRRFSQPDAFFSAGGSLAGSVSELLSNQLSYWMTQVDENLEIDIDLGTLDEEAYNTFQLRLSYRFLDGRLRVSRDGSLAAQDNRANTASLLGDLTVEYMLTNDGRFRVKMYNRTNYNSLNLNQQSTTTAGASLLYTQSFNEIKELLQSARKRKREEEVYDEDDS